uniref:Secreted protein n=1 Tax=Steinernema glaseri TaxID=37863 RepID=A0A1I7ZRY1_9BILA
MLFPLTQSRQEAATSCFCTVYSLQSGTTSHECVLYTTNTEEKVINYDVYIQHAHLVKLFAVSRIDRSTTPRRWRRILIML